MAINSVLNAALSSLNASQAGINTASNNIANVNTPGYARQDVQLTSRNGPGGIAGVDVGAVRRISDTFLVNAARDARAEAAAAQANFDILDRAQSTFGDPAGGASVFDRMTDLFESFGDLAADPASSARRAGAVGDVDALFRDFERINAQLGELRAETDGRIVSTVDRINQLLSVVPDLSAQAIRANATGDNVASVEDQIAQVVDELSELVDVRTSRQPNGALEVRTQDGLLLAGVGAATLEYSGRGASGAGVVYDPIIINFPGAPPATLDSRVSNGELAGLLQARDQDLPELAVQLGELAAVTADALNAAHNDNLSFPPQTLLTGRNTGLAGTDRLGFTGETTVSLVGADGRLVSTARVDFTAGEIYLNGAEPPAVPNATFTAGGAGSINEFIGAFNGLGVGTLTLANGALSADGGANGVAFTQTGATPSARGGQGFSHFFGLNDIVRSPTPTNFKTGLTGADPHGFTPGGVIDLRLTSASGELLSDASITVPAGDVNALLGALNATGTGLGAFGTFALDANGELGFTPNGGTEGARLTVRNDTTGRGTTGVTATAFFGLGAGARADRAGALQVDPALEADPARVALGRLDPTDPAFAVGAVVTGTGDAAGAQALQLAGDARVASSAAGSIGGVLTTPLDYAGRVASDVGLRAAAAQGALDVADGLASAAQERRLSVEGVNLDEELIKLTQFQQSYNAASRLIQTAQELTDILLSIV